MKARLLKVLILVSTLAQVVVFAVFLIEHLGDWHRAGWAGIAILPEIETPELAFESELLQVLTESPGMVVAVAPGSPAARAGLMVGDVVVSIDGVPVDDREALEVLDRQRHRGDRLVYERWGVAATEKLGLTLVSPFDRLETRLELAATLFAGLLFLAIGVWVVWARPANAGGWVFYGLASAGAGLFVLWAPIVLELPNLRGFFVFRPDSGLSRLSLFLSVLTLLVTNLLLHFSLIFPRRRPFVERKPSALVWLHALPILPFAIPNAVGFAAIWSGALVVLVYPVLTGAAFYRSYRESEVRDQRRLRWLAWGLWVVLGGGIFAAVLTIALGFMGAADTLFSVGIGSAVKLLLAAIPLSFAFGLLEYRLQAVDVLLRRTLAAARICAIVLIGTLCLAILLGIAMRLRGLF